MRDFFPDIRQVRSLVAVVDSGNFTKAAEKLGVTQSAVSHSIRTLEERFDVKLVDRSSKRVCVTQDGVVLLRHFRNVISELEEASQNIEMLQRWGQGRIRIGATRTLCRFILPSVIREFREHFPRCEIRVESDDTSELLGMLDRSEIDLVFGMRGREPRWSCFQKIFEDELVFAVPPEHRWAGMKEVPLREMSSEPMLVYGKTSETYRLLQSLCEQQKVKLRTSLSLGDMGVITEMAKTGIGVGVTASWVVREEVKSGQLVVLPMEEPIKREWGIFYLEGRELSATEEAFVRLCERETASFNELG